MGAVAGVREAKRAKHFALFNYFIGKYCITFAFDWTGKRVGHRRTAPAGQRSCLESQRTPKKARNLRCNTHLFRILMEVLSKDMIRQWVLPALTFSAYGRPSAVEPVELVQVIRYKLKSGCQWRMLPVKQFFTGASLTWQGVYARFNAWRKDGSWQAVWLNLLRQNGAHLDCSSVQLDGSHTPAKNGGEAVGYQGRKKPASPRPCSWPTTGASPWPAPARRRATTTTPTGSTPCLGNSAPRLKRPIFPSLGCF